MDCRLMLQLPSAASGGQQAIPQATDRPCFSRRQRLPCGSHGHDGGRHRQAAAVAGVAAGSGLVGRLQHCLALHFAAQIGPLHEHQLVCCAAGKVVGIEKHPELVEKVGLRLRLLLLAAATAAAAAAAAAASGAAQVSVPALACCRRRCLAAQC